MQIDRAAIFRFGKLADRTVDFAPGINIVYGKNEAGKTTLHAFLTAMLFGLEKGRGRAKGTEGYLRYEPWHAPSYYSGALQFSVGGRPFYLERNFYHKEPRARLCNLADGEELSVAYGDLGMLLGGVTREAYENTCDIPQCRAVTGAELTGLLAEYLSDMSDGGNAGIRVTRAVEKLEQKKRSLQSQIKSEQEKREQQLQQLTLERRMLEEDCGRLREQIEKAENERAYLESVLQELAQAETEQEFNEIRRELQETNYLKKSSGKKEQKRAFAPRTFKTSGGLEVLVGRSNVQNDQLTKKADKRDYWFHTQHIHGSHVILRCAGLTPGDEDLREAAMLAAYFSQAKESSGVPVDYCPVKFVKKPAGARPGMVTYDNYRTLYVTPEEGLVKKLFIR